MKLLKHLLVILSAVTGAGAGAAMQNATSSSDPTNHSGIERRAQSPLATAKRQAEVARRSGPVMGFDLDRSLHKFAPTRDGGILTITSRDGDPTQVQRIRLHLQYQSKTFRRGDWANPIHIHGSEMPGLSTLVTAGNEFMISYEVLPRGAQIKFVSSDEGVILAVHRWFGAQNTDHGKHAGHR